MTTLPSPAFLFPEELAQIRADAEALMSDPGASVLVVYKDFVSESFDPRTGVKMRTYVTIDTDQTTGAPLRAIRNAVPAREVQNSDGLYETGDIRFTVTRAAVGAGVVPSRDDLLIEVAPGITYDFVSWDSDPISLLWPIVARKVS